MCSYEKERGLGQNRRRHLYDGRVLRLGLLDNVRDWRLPQPSTANGWPRL